MPVTPVSDYPEESITAVAGHGDSARIYCGTGRVTKQARFLILGRMEEMYNYKPGKVESNNVNRIDGTPSAV